MLDRADSDRAELKPPDKAKPRDLLTLGDATHTDGTSKVSRGSVQSRPSSKGTGTTWTHEPKCPLLFVTVAIFDEAKVTSVTHDGQPLAYLQRMSTAPSDAGIGVTMSTEIWFRANVGSACSATCEVAVTLTSPATFAVGSVDWCGVTAGVPPSGGTVEWSVPLMTSTMNGLLPGSAVLDIVAAESQNGLVLLATGGTQSALWQQPASAKEAAASSAITVAGGAATTIWQAAGSVAFTAVRSFVVLSP